MRGRPDFAVKYLEVSADEATDNIGRAMLVKALHDVAKFRGLTEVAERAGMTPESLTLALSDHAAMTVDTLGNIMNALGMKLAVVPVEPPVPTPKKPKPAAKPKTTRKTTA